MQKNIQNDEDDKMKTTDNSKVVSEMIKEKQMMMLLAIGEQEEINPKINILEKGKIEKLRRTRKKQTRN